MCDILAREWTNRPVEHNGVQKYTHIFTDTWFKTKDVTINQGEKMVFSINGAEVHGYSYRNECNLMPI